MFYRRESSGSVEVGTLIRPFLHAFGKRLLKNASKTKRNCGGQLIIHIVPFKKIVISTNLIQKSFLLTAR